MAPRHGYTYYSIWETESKTNQSALVGVCLRIHTIYLNKNRLNGCVKFKGLILKIDLKKILDSGVFTLD